MMKGAYNVATGIILTSICFVLLLVFLVMPIVKNEFELAKQSKYEEGRRDERKQKEKDLINAYLTVRKLKNDIEAEKSINKKLLDYIKNNGAEPKRIAVNNQGDIITPDYLKYFTKIRIPQFEIMARTAFSNNEEIEKEIDEIREKAGLEV